MTEEGLRKSLSVTVTLTEMHEPDGFWMLREMSRDNDFANLLNISPGFLEVDTELPKPIVVGSHHTVSADCYVWKLEQVSPLHAKFMFSFFEVEHRRSRQKTHARLAEKLERFVSILPFLEKGWFARIMR